MMFLQIFEVAKALAAYAEEGRDPDVLSLAAASRVSQRVTAAAVAMFETAGLVHIGMGKQIELLVTLEELIMQARRLREQLRTLRIQDGERLNAIDSYAIAERCRGELFGEYFGIPMTEECGVCDICRRAPARSLSFFEPIRKKSAGRKKSSSRKKTARKSRGRRGSRNRSRRRGRAKAPSSSGP